MEKNKKMVMMQMLIGILVWGAIGVYVNYNCIQYVPIVAGVFVTIPLSALITYDISSITLENYNVVITDISKLIKLGCSVISLSCLASIVICINSGNSIILPVIVLLLNLGCVVGQHIFKKITNK